MKKHFPNRMEAVNWIAKIARDESQFEVLREEMNFNHIYTGQYFISLEEFDQSSEVVWLAA